MVTTFIIYFHYLGIMTLLGTLLTEHLILKRSLTAQQIRSLARTDLIYGISALVVLATGLLRMLVYGKGVDYYLSNPWFHVKLTLFVVLGVLSIWPTVRFLKWKREIVEEKILEIGNKKYGNTMLLIRIELFIAAIIPFLAVMMARGYGM